MSRILVVDDEVRAVSFLKDELERWNYEVLVATSGSEALQIVESHRPHLMLLDIRMPGLNGIEVLRRAKDVDPSLSVIMVTAVAEQAIAKEALQAGADDYVTKPIDLNYLETTILVELTARSD
ncbi:MAG: response regulator [Candidatus Tectomicrobia bacterium]|nr:response regulator [Candidatus Tectomicrobia bacterium]